jgi:O-antigen/teichoic acid export membrane protein
MTGSVKRLYYKNFLVLFTSSSIGQAIPFLLAPLIGRIFSPEDLAVQENFLAIVSFISIVAAGRYEMAFVLPKDQKRANNLFALALALSVVFTFLSFLALLFREEISDFYNDAKMGRAVIWLAPAVLLLALNNILMQWMIRAGKYPVVSAGRITQTLVQNVGYIVLGYWGWGVNGLIFSWILGNLLSLILLIPPSLSQLSRTDITRGEIRSVAKEYRDFPLVNSLHSFSDIFASQFLLYWLITRNYGIESLGLFAVMSRYIRAPLTLVGSAVGQLYYKEASGNRNQNIPVLPVFNNSVKVVMIAAVPAMIVVFFFGPEIFAFYLGEKWRLAGEYASIMSPAILFNFMVSPVSTTPLIYQRQKTSYLLGLGCYVISFGFLIYGSATGYGFKQSLLFYSLSLSVCYFLLFFWYRSLTLQKQ